MPELPEVEVVRAGLEPALVGATITGVEVFDRRALTRHDPATGDFAAAAAGRRVLACVRRGKFLWMPLAARQRASARVQQPDSSTALLAHLGMSGQLLLRRADSVPERNLRVRLSVEHPVHGEWAVHFVDQRTFGSLALDSLVATPDARAAGRGSALALIPRQVEHIARDPLDPAFDDGLFVATLRERSSTLKRALLDQRLISGIGNIYADEALWASRLHFDQPTGAVTVRAAHRLLMQVRVVLNRALAEGGTSFDAQYVNVNGQAGYFSRSLNVYGKAGSPCPRCGTPLRRASFMNRSSHFCPRCQRIGVRRRSGDAPGGFSA